MTSATNAPESLDSSQAQPRRKMIPVSRHWMECTEPDGVTRFYYNISTGESSWVEPEEVRRTVRSLEQLNVEATQDLNKRQLVLTVDPTAWVERRDAAGRIYYFNTVTKASVWEMPSELKELKELSCDPDNNKLQEKREKEFLRLLEEKGVGVNWTWDDTLKEIISHPSYKALSSLSERKASFSKYIESLKKNVKDRHKDHHHHPRDEFMDALSSLNLTKATRYAEVEEKLKRLDCFSRLSHQDKLELFDRHIKNLSKKHKEQLMDKVMKHLWSKNYEFGKTGWLDVKDELISTFSGLSKMNILSAWERFVLVCEERAIEQAHRDRKDQQQAMKLAISEFKKLLKQLAADGNIKFSTKFNQVVRLLEESKQYHQLFSLNRLKPHSLFLSLIDQLQEDYERDQEFIQSLASKNLPFDQYIAILTLLNPHHVEGVLGPDWRTPAHAVSLIEPKRDLLKQDGLHSEDSIKDKFRPQIDRYKHLLKHFSPPITFGSAFKDFEPKLCRHEEFQALPPQLCHDYFEKYQLYLKRKAEDLPDQKLSKEIK